MKRNWIETFSESIYSLINLQELYMSNNHINEIIERGGQFTCISHSKCQIIDIDTSKDIERAKEIFV